MKLGVFLDLDTVDRNDLDLTALRAALPEWRMHGLIEAGDTLSCIGDAEVVVSNKVRLDRAILTSAPELRLVCLAATGTNNVDLAAACERGITVSNVRGYCTQSVVQHVFALLFALTTRLCDYRDAVRAGRWHASRQFCLMDYPIHELAGRTLGVIGHGELGQAVARSAACFGMKVLIAERRGAAPRPGRLALDEVLARADAVTLHCPLDDSTRGLIGARELALMKPDALLINTARGGIVDEAALADALRAGRLGGAGVDVLSQEPPAVGNPLLAADTPNLLVTPHTAWAGHAARQRVLDEIAANIRAYRAGTPRNVC